MKCRWQDEIPESAFHSHERLSAYLLDVLPKRRGLLLSRGLTPYLDEPQDKGVSYPLTKQKRGAITRRKNSLILNRNKDPLIKLFAEWGREELRGPRYRKYKHKNKVVFELRSDNILKTRRQLVDAVKGITSLLAYKMTVSELVTLAKMGDDASLLRLVSLDRLFLTARFCQDRIWKAQGMEDMKFFNRLAHAMTTDHWRGNAKTIRLGVSCYLLWHLGFNKLPRRQLFEFLWEKGKIRHNDPETFYRMLNRIGIRTYRKVGHKKA